MKNLFVVIISFFCLTAVAHATVASCKAAIGASAASSQNCSLTVAAGDTVIMAYAGPSPHFCEKTTGSTSVQTQTCTISVASGDTVIMFTGGGTNSSPTFSSTGITATWTQQLSQQRQTSGHYIVEADATPSSTGQMTCSVNEGSSQTFWMMGCYDIGPLGIIDVSSGNTGGSSSATSTVNTGTANDILIVINQQQGAAGWTIGTGYAIEAFDYGNSGTAIADKTAGATGTYTATSSSSSTSWAQMTIAYKPATGSPINPTYSSSPSETWTQEMSETWPAPANASSGTSFMLYVADATASASGSMTCTLNVVASIVSWAMYCFDNGHLGVIDASAATNGISGFSTASLTTTVNNDQLFVLNGQRGGVSYTVDTGYTVEQSDFSFSGSVIADKLAASAGSQSATTSVSASGTKGMIIVAYKPPPSSGVRHRSQVY